MKTNNPVATKTSSLASEIKPGRAEIRREEPRRSAPRATERTPERSSQPRAHQPVKK